MGQFIDLEGCLFEKYTFQSEEIKNILSSCSTENTSNQRIT